jgi:hypothetical protein
MLQLRVVDGLTGFSNMSFPCFSTKTFALLASIESSQGSCTSSLTWSLGDIHSPGRALSEEARAKIQVIAGPLIPEREKGSAF